MIDFSRPFDTRISEQRLEKYQDLKRELKRIWKGKKALGALEIVSATQRKWLQELDVAELELLQKVCLLGIASLFCAV